MEPISSQPSPSSKVLELERVFKARPEVVFDAFSTGDAMGRWFGPGYCGVLESDLDFREGGTYRLRLSTEQRGEVTLVGSYRTIDRPKFLAFTWRWKDNPAFNPCDSTVEISFAEHPEGTLLSLRQIGIEDDGDRTNHGFGWNGAFDKLEKLYL